MYINRGMIFTIRENSILSTIIASTVDLPQFVALYISSLTPNKRFMYIMMPCLSLDIMQTYRSGG